MSISIDPNFLDPNGIQAPITVPPPDSGTPPGWPGYNPATPSPTPSPTPTPTPSPTPSPPATITDSLIIPTPAINFPPPSLPLMDARGNVNVAWYHVLLTLFQRSGGQPGPSGTSAGTELAVGTPVPGQIDALRQEIDALRAEVEMTRRPDRDGLRTTVAQLHTLAATLTANAPHGPPATEIYAFMRR